MQRSNSASSHPITNAVPPGNVRRLIRIKRGSAKLQSWFSVQHNRDDGRVFRNSVVEHAVSGAQADNIRPMGDTQILRDNARDVAQVHRKLVMTAAMSSL